MEQYYGYGAVAVACLLVLFILFTKRKAEFILNFMVRTVMGLSGIYFVNEFLEKQQLALQVGMNPITALTAGTLGISGVALLYGIVAYKSL